MCIACYTLLYFFKTRKKFNILYKIYEVLDINTKLTIITMQNCNFIELILVSSAIFKLQLMGTFSYL